MTPHRGAAVLAIPLAALPEVRCDAVNALALGTLITRES